MRRNKKNIYKNLCLLFITLSSFTSFSQEPIIQNGDEWSYFDSGYLNDNWFQSTDFSNWKTGVTPIGYGDRAITTEIYFGKSKHNKDIAKYFIKRINIKNPSTYTGIEFKLQRDDGAVIYINGKELYRDNMPDGNITPTTRSLLVVNDKEEKKFYTKIFDKSIFTKGINTIAVEVHQYNIFSSDCIFSMEVIGHNDPNFLAEVIKNQMSNKASLEAKIDVLNYTFLLENTSTQLEIYKNSNQNLKFLLFLVCSLLIITIIGGFIVYFKNRNNEDAFKNTIKKLNFDVIENEKKMISISTQLLHYRQHLKEVKADLSFLKTDNNKALNNTIKQIDFIIENNDDWDQLKLHFDSVFSGFYDKILAKSPTLTETELRHCMFIKLHIQTKEIARILNVDPRSVQTARYRIKKKLNLTEEQDLRSFLITI
jgi:DNA-binding CsgD family transcriptional regulator